MKLIGVSRSDVFLCRDRRRRCRSRPGLTSPYLYQWTLRYRSRTPICHSPYYWQLFVVIRLKAEQDHGAIQLPIDRQSLDQAPVHF